MVACLRLSPMSVLCAPVFWLAASDTHASWRFWRFVLLLTSWHASACTCQDGKLPGQKSRRLQGVFTDPQTTTLSLCNKQPLTDTLFAAAGAWHQTAVTLHARHH